MLRARTTPPYLLGEGGTLAGGSGPSSPIAMIASPLPALTAKHPDLFLSRGASLCGLGQAAVAIFTTPSGWYTDRW